MLKALILTKRIFLAHTVVKRLKTAPKSSFKVIKNLKENQGYPIQIQFLTYKV